jgi:hypothetical protein
MNEGIGWIFGFLDLDNNNKKNEKYKNKNYAQ